MAITLGNYTFTQPLTALHETLEELGGRDARAIKLQGILQGFTTQAALEAELDLLLASASASEAVPLSLREGRQFLVRRTGFKREIVSSPLTGAFTLSLEANPAFETAIDETTLGWYFGVSGATKVCATAGNLAAPARIELLASQALLNPGFSDGIRSITYEGEVAMGDTLIFDGPGGTVTLEGEDVTPYTRGLIPQIAPPQSTLTYTDDPASSHAGIAVIRYHDRWW